MLVPRHPQPVARRRAVAEMTVAYKQAATIPPGHVFEIPSAAVPEGAEGVSRPRPSPESELSRNGDDTPV